jgi:hypothetical protein
MKKTNARKATKNLGSITIEGRYNGPPHVANGGYVCGLLAKFIEGTADIWIRRPTPLDQELSMVEYEDETLCILYNSDVVVEGKPGNLDLDMPESPGFDQAAEAAKTSRAIRMNEFNDRKFMGIHPTCFCCGAERTDHHGLKIHPGLIPGKNIIAAPWIPGDDLADEDGKVRPEFIWTALDCPGAFATLDLGNGHPGLLGRLVGQVLQPIKVKEPCVVVARAVSSEGRKHFAGTAVYNSKGDLAGKAMATWIART